MSDLKKKPIKVYLTPQEKKGLEIARNKFVEEAINDGRVTQLRNKKTLSGFLHHKLKESVEEKHNENVSTLQMLDAVNNLSNQLQAELTSNRELFSSALAESLFRSSDDAKRKVNSVMELQETLLQQLKLVQLSLSAKGYEFGIIEDADISQLNQKHYSHSVVIKLIKSIGKDDPEMLLSIAQQILTMQQFGGMR